VTSQRDTVRFSETEVTATLRTGAEFRVPLEVGERLVHLARWFTRHVEPEADGAHGNLSLKGN